MMPRRWPGLFVAVLLATTAAPGQDPTPIWVTPEVKAPGVTQHTYASACAGTQVSYFVYEPSAYATEPERRFPVIYWLHGSGPSQAGVASVARHFAAAMADGRMPQALVVFPNGLPLGMWCDAKSGATRIETMLVDELLPLIDGSWRTIAARAGRLIEGFSMGGYGAARLGFKYVDRFAAASCLAGGPLQLDFLTNGPRTSAAKRRLVFNTVYGGDQAYFEAQSPWRLAETNRDTIAGGLRLRVVIGEQDEMLEIVRAFHQHLIKLAIDHEYLEQAGVGHNAGKALARLPESSWAFYRDTFAAPVVEEE